MEMRVEKVSCGPFSGDGDWETGGLRRPGLALVPPNIRWVEGIAAMQAKGDSMDPLVADGSWCIFYPIPDASRPDPIVLVEQQNATGSLYALKKYQWYSSDGDSENTQGLLLSLNRRYAPIQLDPYENYRIRGWFVGAVPEVQRIEAPRYERIEED